MGVEEIIRDALRDAEETSSDEINDFDKSVSGEIIKQVRLRLGVSQPKFARSLSSVTNEHIESIDLCRMERYKKEKACHPITPSSEVKRVIYSTHTYLKKKNQTEIKDLIHEHNSDKKQMEDNSGINNSTDGNSTEKSIKPTVTKEQLDNLSEIISIYKELGISKTKKTKAVEIVKEFQSESRALEQKLFGSTSEITDVRSRIQEIEDEESKIKAEIAEIEKELSNTPEELLSQVDESLVSMYLNQKG